MFGSEERTTLGTDFNDERVVYDLVWHIEHSLLETNFIYLLPRIDEVLHLIVSMESIVCTRS